MITPNNTLEVLDNVHIDTTLPKYKVKKAGDPNYLAGIGTPAEQMSSPPESDMMENDPSSFAMQVGMNRLSNDTQTPFFTTGSVQSFVVNSGEINRSPIPNQWSPLASLKGLFAKKKAVAPVKPKVSVEDVFILILRNQQELDFVADRMTSYDNSIAKAKLAGQIALSEQLLQARKIYAYETELFAIDRKKFIDEKRVVEFAKDCEKGLCLTWLKNYTRAIPDAVLEQKMILDKHRIFDAYVVMHYDPEKKSIKQTEAEKAAELAKRKDPILFGIIHGSRKLYFVGDWKDELCDLTFDAFVQKYGESSVLLKGQ